jgi:hypothetical protein
VHAIVNLEFVYVSPFAKPAVPEHVVLLTELDDKFPPEPNSEKLNPLLLSSHKMESFPSAYFKPLTTSPLAHSSDGEKSLGCVDIKVVKELIPSLPGAPLSPLSPFKPCGPTRP